VSFDPTQDNYIGTLINPSDAGVGGNEYINWIDRPEFLENDPEDLDTFVVREPASFFDQEFEGQANGIPTDPLFSSELDRAVIGNPAAQTGIYNFADPEQFDISLLITPGFSSGAVLVSSISVCTQRGDCLYIVDPPFGLNAQQVVDWHNGMLFTDLQVALDTSYGALYHPWVKIFDQFNGGEIFIPPSGHVSAVFARTDRVAEIWFAPAGLNRGKLITALGLETEHNRGQRDLMYGFNNAVNPIINFPQRGIHIWGQRTLQRKDSALDRVNVRMLLIAIKKALAGPRGLLNEFLFEQNDAITRRLVTDAVDNYMNDVANRRGVTAWKTICDETNNTPIRIDRNELWISLLLKPTRVIEFIVLNIGILRTDQSFASEEVLGAVGVNTVS
jgi:phage tail sheath protein FI